MNGRAISGPLIPGHPSAPVICGVRRLPLKETNVIAVRPLRWTDDRAALLALDTSFTTDRLFRLERTDRGLFETVMVHNGVHLEVVRQGQPLEV